MQFKVVSSDAGNSGESDTDPHSRIEKMLTENPVFLFMKGTPESPQCGFSSKVVDMLATKKQEVSNNMFADKVETEPEEEIQAEPEEVVTEPITEPEEETTEVQV